MAKTDSRFSIALNDKIVYSQIIRPGELSNPVHTEECLVCKESAYYLDQYCNGIYHSTIKVCKCGLEVR
jgi:hypothetical protein